MIVEPVIISQVEPARDCLPPAFVDLYDQSVEQIYRYHLSRTGDALDAQDLTADTFRAALEWFSSYRPERGRPLAWLIGIARHKQIDYLRGLSRHKSSPLTLEQAEQHPSGWPSPEDQAIQHMQVAQVARALRGLSQDRAEAISLHFFAGLSLGEVGKVMGKREEAIKKLVHRGLKDLKHRLAGRAEEEA